MTYLELINKVLDRLREPRITSGQIDSTPFYRTVGACVNDAKDSVENSWSWSALRGEDTIALAVGEEIVTLPDSADTPYVIQRVRLETSGNYLRQWPVNRMAEAYVSDTASPVANGTPTRWAPYYNDTSGNQRIRLYVRPDSPENVVVERVKHQDALSASTDTLLIPSLPVYALATALAARERGEVGGSPVAELFAVADTFLSDAIALDASRFPSENVWYNADVPFETNNRYI